MDVLNPELSWIGNRCYRKVLIRPIENDGFDQMEDFPEDDNEPCSTASCDPAELEEDIEVVPTPDGAFQKATLPIASAYFKYIIGRQGATKRQLETDTRTTIFIPRMGQEGDLVIKGKSQADVLSCCRRILLKIAVAREQLPFTHFLSIPFTCTDIEDNFEEFQRQVLESCSGVGSVDKSLFQNPKKLHMTLGTMVLMGEQERAKADATLNSCIAELINPFLEDNGIERLVVEMSGLEILNDDPSNVDVLYGKLSIPNSDDPTSLQDLCDKIVDYFVGRGVMLRQSQYDRVKLHVTLLNTIFRRPDEQGMDEADRAAQDQRQRISFDATPIMEQFGTFYFGCQPVDEIHVSQRFATGKEGYYYATCRGELN